MRRVYQLQFLLGGIVSGTNHVLTMYGLTEDDVPRPFKHRGYDLLCSPNRIVPIVELFDLYGETLHIRKSQIVSVMIDWRAFASEVKNEKRLWLLLVALQILSYEKRDAWEIRLSRNEPLCIMRGGKSYPVYFRHKFHATVCLSTVFGDVIDRHLYHYGPDGSEISHENVW